MFSPELKKGSLELIVLTILGEAPDTATTSDA